MKYSYSIRGRTNEATCTKDGEIQFFLNRIKINYDRNPKIKIFRAKSADSYIDSLITYLNAVELHELGHIFNWEVGCKHGKNFKQGSCPWCEETHRIYYLLQNMKEM